jgi:hypothetical protein
MNERPPLIDKPPVQPEDDRVDASEIELSPEEREMIRRLRLGEVAIVDTKTAELVSAEDAMKEFFRFHTKKRMPRSIVEESNSGHIAFLTRLSKLEDPNEVCRIIDARLRAERKAHRGQAYV